jgi:two-component system, chemotaxis family, sensor kinase Cph1
MDKIITSCNLPRKFIGIQSIGYLFILDRNDLKIKGVSANVPGEIGMTKESIYLLENFCMLMEASIREFIFNYLMYKLDKKSTRIILLYNKTEYYCHSYKSGDYIVIELEKKNDLINIPYSIVHNLQNDIRMTEFSKETLVEIVKNFTGFERVMMYKFNSDWTGKVVCERVSEESVYKSVSYEGVYFHETDVPVYIRGLYCKNPLRYIYDAHEKPVDICWGSVNTVEYVDSRNSEVVSTTESHSRYLKGINAVSSFSIAILVNLKLWGLIVCHNPCPKYVSPFIRQQCYNFVSMYAENMNNNNIYTEKSHNDYVYKLYKIANIFNFVSPEENKVMFEYILKELQNISGCDSIIGSLKYDDGAQNMFSEEFDYVMYLVSQNITKFPDIFYSNETTPDLYKLIGVKVSREVVACLIVIKLNGDEWVGFVKKGKTIDVKWAGDNSLHHENGKVYPRRNFGIVEGKYYSVEEFKLSHKNINYIKQLIMFFADRLNKRNYFSEYFTFHNNIDRQMMISSIVHEIRNPLNGIIGLFDIMNSDKTYKQEYVDDGMAISRQLLNLTTNIIDLSRYTYNETLNFSGIVWVDILKEVIGMYKYIIKPGVAIKHSIEDGMPVLMTDTIKIRQILNNLVSNAVKFTKTGSITISVSLVNKIDNMCWVKLTVQDTGCGIPNDKQIKLFRTFEQANNDFIHSSGLGLVICSQISKLLNGYIDFESEEGIGTRFDVYLPMAISGGMVSDKKDVPTKSNKSKKILVVDDEYINIKVLQYRLEGNQVFTATNAYDAFKIIEDNRDIDVVFMDLRMPGIDGVQATSVLRETYVFKNKIIAVTGHSFDETFYLNKGFDGVIIKPVDEKQLAKWI